MAMSQKPRGERMRPGTGGRGPERSANRTLDMATASASAIHHLDDRALQPAQPIPVHRIATISGLAAMTDGGPAITTLV